MALPFICLGLRLLRFRNWRFFVLVLFESEEYDDCLDDGDDCHQQRPFIRELHGQVHVLREQESDERAHAGQDTQ